VNKHFQSQTETHSHACHDVMVGAAIHFAKKLVPDNIYTKLSIIYTTVKSLHWFFGHKYENKAKWKARMINNKAGIMVHSDAYIGTRVYSMRKLLLRLSMHILNGLPNLWYKATTFLCVTTFSFPKLYTFFHFTMVSGGPFKGLISRNDCIVTAIISLHKW
jgi:hypothetical protein